LSISWSGITYAATHYVIIHGKILEDITWGIEREIKLEGTNIRVIKMLGIWVGYYLRWRQQV